MRLLLFLAQNFPDLFFGDSGDSPLADVRQAKKLCSTCPVQLECATYALEADEDFGVWGGLSSLDRKKLRKRHGSYRKAAEALELRYTKPKSDRLQANRR
jgi:WhiB family transcriptional regulator, redox-sensing transcriptional regulator